MQTKSGLSFEFLPSTHPKMMHVDTILRQS